MPQQIQRAVALATVGSTMQTADTPALAAFIPPGGDMTDRKRPYGAGLTPMARGRKKLAPRYNEDTPAPRNPVGESALCLAIRNQVLVELRHGDDFQPRTFAPYVVYRTSRGAVCVFGMQVSPATPSERADPQTFEVGMIRQVDLTATDFETDPKFDLSSARYRNRICPA